MFGNAKSRSILKAMVVFMSVAMTTAGFSADAEAARIMPSGKVSIIEDGKVVGEFSQEQPLPEGSVLKCEGRCAIKLDDAYMVVEGDTVFSLQPTATGHMLYVQQGTVYYSISDASRPLKFSTPAGDAATGELFLSEEELRGYVRVSGNETELGVLGGGSMALETDSGRMTVASGKKVTMTLAEAEETVAATGGKKEMNKQTKYVLGALGAGAAAAGVIAFSGGGSGGGDGGGDGSPAAP